MIDKFNFPIISFLLVFFCLIGCSNNTKIGGGDMEKVEKTMQDSIISILRKGSDKHYELYPKDTILKLSDKMKIVLWKNSFLNKDSTLYKGKVHIDFKYTYSVTDILANNVKYPNLWTENLKGILKFEIKDMNGKPLRINPNYGTILWFHPKSNLFNLPYAMFDTSRNEHISFQCVVNRDWQKQNKIDGQNDYLIDENFMDTIHKHQGKKIKYKKRIITKQEAVAYELTIKQSGNYYLYWNYGEENLQPVSINVNVKFKNDHFENWGKMKMFLFSQYKEDMNYYLDAENLGNGQYKIVPSNSQHPYNENPELPLNIKYTLLAYAMDGEDCYLYLKKDMILQKANTLSIELDKVSFNKLVKEIKKI